MELDSTRPLWRQIATEIIRRIKDGTYPPGSRVPSTLETAQEFGVVNATAATAMRHVREAGWTRGEVGLGTFVSDPLPPEPSA
ncbi:winged helix-turn-helix domain-containing protein [Streptomyces sp. NPDC049915]|uniref:GntR family transcriptional regulator n=1 Tax=Streptomyces sp. NPDC049915 TaxID=3155510 RepID=UPI0034176555